jgi:hypothetical protein
MAFNALRLMDIYFNREEKKTESIEIYNLKDGGF